VVSWLDSHKESLVSNIPYRPYPKPEAEALADHRERRKLELLEAAERREKDLLEQGSPTNTADTRIRIWERRHGLTLPRTPDHPLINIIAAGTALTVEQVHEEQRIRAEAAKQRKASPRKVAVVPPQ
jgi:hypothetical protein